MSVNWIPLAQLNALRFPTCPVPDAKLWRWCREGHLPARKFGGDWYVDLDAFDRGETGEKPKEIKPPRAVQLVVDRLRKV